MQNEHFIPGKDASLEHSIASMQAKLAALGFELEECSWLNPVDNVWSVHVRNRECPLMFTNGKGATRLAAHASALGEFFERLSCNYFWNHYYLGESIAKREFAHYPRERWFPVTGTDWPGELLTPELQAFYNPEGSIPAESADRHQYRQRTSAASAPFPTCASAMVPRCSSRSTSSATSTSAMACRPATRRPRRAPRRCRKSSNATSSSASSAKASACRTCRKT